MSDWGLSECFKNIKSYFVVVKYNEILNLIILGYVFIPCDSTVSLFIFRILSYLGLI